MKAILFLVMTCLSMVAASAATIGDPAAPLQVGKWIKGGPVTLADGKDKTIYVVEFWATWCPPCLESIPHLSALQAKYKDKGVVVIGLTGEKEKVVKPFVEKMGGKMEYAVGIDADEQTSKAYMDAYKQDGIPTAFVIDKSGVVVWVGNPLDDLDEVVERVVAGSYDMQAAKDESAEDEGDALHDEYFEAANRRDGKDAAAKVGAEILKEQADAPEKLNEFAWRILTDEVLHHRDYPLALSAALRAFEQTQGKDCAIVDTYARALFMTGKVSDAIAMQRKAVDLSDSPKERLELKETLAGYEHPAADRGQDDDQRVDRFIREAAALVAAGKAVSPDQLLARTDVKPSKVELAKPSTRTIASEDLYEQARQSVLMVGTLKQDGEPEDWDVALATGFIIHESGIFVTNFHVVDHPGASVMAAMTADGKVYPVKSVLAVAPFADIAICQLDGASGMKPLPLVSNAKPGSHLRILSHPDSEFYSFSEGVVSRYSVYRADGKSTTVLATTAEFASGSSGGPAFDNFGNVVGMVASSRTIYSGPEEPSEDPASKAPAGADEDKGDMQMVLKLCVPAAEILKLVGGNE